MKDLHSPQAPRRVLVALVALTVCLAMATTISAQHPASINPHTPLRIERTNAEPLAAVPISTYQAMLDAVHYVLSIDTAAIQSRVATYEASLKGCAREYDALASEYSALTQSFAEYDAIHQSHTKSLTASLKRAHSANNALMKMQQIQMLQLSDARQRNSRLERQNRVLKGILPTAIVAGFATALMVTR